MALVIVCGQPCSGKTTAAACLAGSLESCGKALNVIDEPSLNLDRNESYRDMPSEKNLRGLIRSAVDRSLSKDAIVILDSLNNIKGYRYELWCLARAAGLQYCVLHCDADLDDCRSWNKLRQDKGEPSYDDKIFDDLACRFERPDNRNRWDSPLMELKPKQEEIKGSSSPIVEIVKLLSGIKDDRSRGARCLQPTIATQNVRISETNSLYELNRATQDVITTVIGVQSESLGAGSTGISVGKGFPIVSLEKTVGLPELRRLRRTFLKLAGQSGLSGPPPPSDYDSAKRMFVEYLNQELLGRSTS